ncbi:MAG TPA: 3TM-type holin [Geminicoccaceae bacterium]|nr:3TM-type holin [Geminicoccaceae bacterium]
MRWLSAITTLLRPAWELVEALRHDAGNRADRGHGERLELTEQDLAALRRFATEFQARERRTRWDALIDGLNRLPRPLITLGILAFFLLAPLAPARFLEIARTYQLLPDGFWALLSVIIAFYFGGRMQLKREDTAVKRGALNVAREILAIRHSGQTQGEPAPRPLPTSPPDRSDGSAEVVAPGGNRVVEAWSQMAAGQR